MRRDYEPDVSQILALYQQLEDDILASMTKRMLKMGYVSESTKYQAEILQSAGLLREDVAQMIAQRTDASVQQVKALFEDAGVETVRIDNEIYREAGVLPIDIRQDEGMRKLLEEGYRKTLGTMQNLTGTTAAQTEQQFVSACDRAYMQVSSGAFSYQEAIMTAVRGFADVGAEVVYPSGHRDKLDVAVRRAVLTGVGQATAAVSLKHADEAGCYLMELSAHSGARPGHAEWQGQLVSRTGKNAGRTIDGLYVYTLDQIGYGTGRGFKGWNCRHNWYPYYEGFSKPNYTKQQIAALNAKNIPYNGQMYSEYEISQMQRTAERKIRKLKRRLITAQESIRNAPDNATRAAAQNYYNRNAVKLKDAERQLRDFCNQTGQWNDRFRTQVSGFGQSEAQKAVWANRKAQQGKNPPPASPAAPSVPKSPKPKNPSGSAANSLTSSNRSGIISVKGFADDNFDRKAKITTANEDLKATNPNYSPGNHFSDNCQRCVPAYVLRRQGYNVEALPTGKNLQVDQFLSNQPNAVWKKDGSPVMQRNTLGSQYFGKPEIHKFMKDLPDGAMCEVRCVWEKDSTGHVFIAEKRNGKVHFIDPQTGSEDVSHYFSKMKKNSTYFWRIDDAQLDEKYIEFCCKNKGGE